MITYVTFFAKKELTMWLALLIFYKGGYLPLKDKV